MADCAAAELQPRLPRISTHSIFKGAARAAEDHCTDEQHQDQHPDRQAAEHPYPVPAKDLVGALRSLFRTVAVPMDAVHSLERGNLLPGVLDRDLNGA